MNDPTNTHPPSAKSTRIDVPHRPLATLALRDRAVVAEVDLGNDEAISLKSLGICAGRQIEMLRSGDPLVVRVLGSRVGISKRLAERVYVRTA